MNTFKFPPKIKLTADQINNITLFMDETPPMYVTATEIMLMFEKISRILIEESEDNILTLQIEFTQKNTQIGDQEGGSPIHAIFNWVYTFIERWNNEGIS